MEHEYSMNLELYDTDNSFFNKISFHPFQSSNKKLSSEIEVPSFNG